MVDSIENVIEISDEICQEVEACIRPYYNDIIENEVKSDFECPMKLIAAEYNNILPKLNWNFSVSTACCTIGSRNLMNMIEV
jgi:hypothetical protein